MGQVVIVAYRPKVGKEEELLALTREHYGILREQGLVSPRPPIIVRTKDGTLVEIFEWESGAMERAHANPAVLELWKRYEAACDYVPLSELAESENLFAAFEAVN
jgi:hypothetical protein